MWEYQSKKMFQTKNQGINLIIGDSRGMSGINPETLSEKYINLSIGGATFFEGLHTLKRVILGNNKIDTLILCYGQFHYELSDVLNERTIPFNFVNYKELSELNKIENKTNQCIDSRHTGRPTSKMLLTRFLLLSRNPFVYQNTFIDNLKNNYVSSGIVNMIESLKQNKGHVLFGQEDSASLPAKEANYINFYQNKVLEYYLDSIFYIANKEGIKVFIISPPISQLTYNMGEKKYFADYDNYLKSINKKHPQCNIVNYTTIYKNNLFGDPSHLNKSGCILFTKYVKLKVSSHN